MDRRLFLTTLSSVALAPAFAMAGDTIEFDDSDPIAAALADGKVVVVDYTTEWCSTCARQKRVMGQLRGENPAYDDNLVFVSVDFDKFGRKPVTVDRNIPRRSTLLVLKGGEELVRIVAGTAESDIRAMLDTALSAAANS